MIIKLPRTLTLAIATPFLMTSGAARSDAVAVYEPGAEVHQAGDVLPDSTRLNLVSPTRGMSFEVDDGRSAGTSPEFVIPGQALDFRKAIRALESEHGAYAEQLSEYLGSLGVNLQQRGMHKEAIEVFKRGVHLSRINEGLYSSGQIPLLEKEIASLVAVGEYTEADERQVYLYRVQMRNFEAGPERAEAFMHQADWQYRAYRMGLGQNDFSRLVSIWDLNSLALNDIATLEGQASAALIAPLKGMLRAQYLIADYNFNQTEYGVTSNDSYTAQSQMNRFNAFRSQSFGKGEAVVDSIYDIQVNNHGQNSAEAAEARALQGDWLLYHGQRNGAEEHYRLAVAELAPRDDAEAEIERLFGEPVELPDDDVVRYLPTPVAVEEGRLVLQFSVSDSGRVTDMERVDNNEVNQSAVNRIMRTLRSTRFRPRLESAGPVATEMVTRAYDIE
ncbi:energy transducer TonB [Haliea sp. E17]|uniref:energy transducer TonB n=1 Tax=Haliea sp. E17 TaxID=3401576 RepID=UPI003AABCE3F